VKKNIIFDDNKNCVLNDKPKNVKINAIRTLKLTNYSLTQDKFAYQTKMITEFGLIKHHQDHTDIGKANKSGGGFAPLRRLKGGRDSPERRRLRK
jgi:hypothetical protein